MGNVDVKVAVPEGKVRVKVDPEAENEPGPSKVCLDLVVWKFDWFTSCTFEEAVMRKVRWSPISSFSALTNSGTSSIVAFALEVGSVSSNLNVN